MRDMNQYFPSTFLKAGDLKGQVARVVIAKITEATFKDKNSPSGEKTVPELHFQGKDKTFTLNITNRNELMKAFGPDGDLWIGKTIELHPTKTSIAGEIKDTILVGVPQGPAQPAPAPQTYTPPVTFQDQQNEGCNDDFSDVDQDDMPEDW